MKLFLSQLKRRREKVLDEKTKSWAKKNLKKDLLFLLKLQLENL